MLGCEKILDFGLTQIFVTGP